MSVSMNDRTDSSIVLEQPIQSGPRVWFKWFRPYTPSKWTTYGVLLSIASLTTILALVFALCGASVPATEVHVKHLGSPTGAKVLRPDGDCVGPQYLEDMSVAERVVGGEEAQPNAWPWQISLQVPFQGRYRHLCGATLINESWAMTAAHCVDGPWKIRAVAGEHLLYSVSGREQVVNVCDVHIHPKWNGDASKGNDIALVRFGSDLILNQWVQPAALPPAGQILPHNTICYITGWGVTFADENCASCTLMQAYLPLIDHETCSSPDWWGEIVKTNMICAGGNGAQAGCYGDSGGPLNCEANGTYAVHGVTSFGPRGCNVPKKPTVLARVSEYIDWIYQTTN